MRTLQSEYSGRIKPVPVVAVCYWLLMVMTGTDLLDATLLTVAIIFGLMSIGAAGGFKTAPGLLNLVMILKFVLIAVILKAFTLQAADSNLQAPHTTCEVMAVGFFALYAGTLLYRSATKIRGLVRDVTDARMYLALTIVFSVVCIGSSAIIFAARANYSENLAGGLWGVAYQFTGTASFCVVPALYYAWSSGSKRFLSHPLPLGLLIILVVLGTAWTSKLGMMEPLLCYLAVGTIRYGIRSKLIWGIVAGGGILYLSIVYPYSQYVRDHGGREGTIAERLEAVKEVFLNVSTNADYRSMVDSNISAGETYLNKDIFRPISRLAMIGEADRLVAATDATQSYSGWDTIVNGFRLAVPSFLIENKPTSGGGNFLGHVVGELATGDMTTQVSYGFMANLYNAFGLAGVLVGTIIFIFMFYYMLRLWFANPDLELGPWGSSIWYLLIGMSFEHGMVEAPIGNLLASSNAMLAIAALILVSKYSVSFFENRRQPLAYS